MNFRSGGASEEEGQTGPWRKAPVSSSQAYAYMGSDRPRILRTDNDALQSTTRVWGVIYDTGTIRTRTPYREHRFFAVSAQRGLQAPYNKSSYEVKSLR